MRPVVLGSWRPGTRRRPRKATASTSRLTLVIVNTGDRPVQIGSHLHLPDSNTALDFDRTAAHGFRLDIPSGTSVRFEPGVSREVDAVAFRGRRRIPGLQLPATTGRTTEGDLDG